MKKRNRKCDRGSASHSHIKIRRSKTKEKAGSARRKSSVKRANNADDLLRQNDDRYRTIFESSPEAIILLNAEGRILDINQRGADLIGCTRENAVGKHHMELSHLPNETKLKTAESFAGKAQGQDVAPYETEFIGSNGKHRIGLVNLAPIRSNDGKFLGALVMVSDVTQIRQLQQQLLHAQKMESVGQLAGGIAHDFNNVLLSIMGHSELLLATMDEKDLRRQDVLEIGKSVNSAAAVTRHLLAFSRKQMLEPKVIDLNAILKNVEMMLKRLLGEDIQTDSSAGAESSASVRGRGTNRAGADEPGGECKGRNAARRKSHHSHMPRHNEQAGCCGRPGRKTGQFCAHGNGRHRHGNDTRGHGACF